MMDFRHLIDCKKIVQPGAADCPTWNFFVSAFNDSDRVKTVFNRTIADSKYWLVLPEYNYKDEELPAEAFLPKAEIMSEDDVIITALDALIDKLKPESLLCIDVTGMMRPHILFILYYLQSRNITSFDMMYTEPLHYQRKEETAFASKDVSEVRQVTGFEGTHLPNTDEDVLIVGVGYDHHLISHVIDSKPSAQLVQLHSLPSLSADMYQESLLRLERVSSSYTPAIIDNQIYCSANDPFLVAAVLSETIKKLHRARRIGNLYLSPLATKPQAIGFGLFFLKNTLPIPMSMIFPYASSYAKKTSKGIGRTWIYPIRFQLPFK